MLTIEEYIAKRKKEDNLKEWDRSQTQENTRIVINYVFEYFNNYIQTISTDEKTVLHEQKVEKYRSKVRYYNSEVQEWLVKMYSHNGKYMEHNISKTIKDPYYFLYSTDAEFRELSYDCYAKLIRKFPFLKGQTHELFLFLKDYSSVYIQDCLNRSKPFPFICESLNQWIEETYIKYNVSMLAFAFNWISAFYEDETNFPISHRKKSLYTFRKYDYDYKQKTNLFNLDQLYQRMPKKAFIKGRKQEIELLMMYYWLSEISCDEDDYWSEYLGVVLPNIENKG